MCSGSIAAPPVPAPDANQIALEQAQLKALDNQNNLYSGILPVMTQQMGLTYDPSTGMYSMSPEAQKQLQDQQTLTNAQTQLGLSGLPLAQQQQALEQQQLAGEQSLMPQQLAIQKALGDRTQQALNGTLALPKGMTDQKNQEYQQLVRQQATLGNTITGDAPDGAASNSTSGQQALKEFNTRWANTQDAYQLAQLGQGTQQYQAGAGLTSGMASGGYGSSQAYSNPTGYVSNNPTFTGALPSINYTGLASGYGAAQQPYQYQQGMQYQSGAQGAGNYAGLLGGLASSGGMLASAGLMAMI